PMIILFPYTTLFRSICLLNIYISQVLWWRWDDAPNRTIKGWLSQRTRLQRRADGDLEGVPRKAGTAGDSAPPRHRQSAPAQHSRSEEHTSELQSHLN